MKHSVVILALILLSSVYAKGGENKAKATEVCKKTNTPDRKTVQEWIVCFEGTNKSIRTAKCERQPDQSAIVNNTVVFDGCKDHIGTALSKRKNLELHEKASEALKAGASSTSPDPKALEEKENTEKGSEVCTKTNTPDRKTVPEWLACFEGANKSIRVAKCGRADGKGVANATVAFDGCKDHVGTALSKGKNRELHNKADDALRAGATSAGASTGTGTAGSTTASDSTATPSTSTGSASGGDDKALAVAVCKKTNTPGRQKGIKEWLVCFEGADKSNRVARCVRKSLEDFDVNSTAVLDECKDRKDPVITKYRDSAAHARAEAALKTGG